MARYRFASPDNLTVTDTTNGSVVPVTGTYLSDAYQAWKAAGNTTDPYVAPTPVSFTPTQVTPQSYTVANAPSASANTNTIITITDLPEGSRNCYSDGANWRRVSDDTIVV